MVKIVFVFVLLMKNTNRDWKRGVTNSICPGMLWKVGFSQVLDFYVICWAKKNNGTLAGRESQLRHIPQWTFYAADELTLTKSLRGDYFNIQELLLDLAIDFQGMVGDQEEDCIESGKRLLELTSVQRFLFGKHMIGGWFDYLGLDCQGNVAASTDFIEQAYRDEQQT